MLVTLLVAAIGAVIGSYFLFRENPSEAQPFTEKQFNRITKGMTRAEVTAVLGASPGDYSGGKVDYFVMNGGQIADAFTPHAEHKNDQYWFGPDGGLFVDFDEHNCVVGATFFPIHSRSP